MAISRKIQATATPATQPRTQASAPASAQQTQERSVETNGYLDPDQTLVNFAVRELGLSFERLLQDDPALLLRKWLKCYRASRTTAIAGIGLGAGATLAGVLVAASPLTIFGVMAAGGCSLLAKHHNRGAKACELEISILDEIRPVLDLLAQLEARGANRSELVSLYDRLIRQFSAKNPAFGMTGQASELKAFFDGELAKHKTLSQFLSAPTPFAAAADPEVQRPALQPAPQPAKQDIALTAIDAIDLVAAAQPPKTREELLARLKRDCPALIKLVKSHPIRLVGVQQTGKSTLARLLLLLRSVLIEDHLIAYATTHSEAANPAPEALNPFGWANGRKDFAAIERFWAGTQEGVNACSYLNLSVVWDEFGGYGDGFENEELLGKSLRSLLRESAKHGYFPILVAHGDQAEHYPGIAGILTTLKASTVKLETIGEPSGDLGEFRPTGRARITWIGATEEEEIEIPRWLTCEYLLATFPAPKKAFIPPAATQERSQERSPATQERSPQEELAIEVALQPASELDRAIAPIISYLKGKNEGRPLDDIYRSSPLRTALGSANKPLTEAALQRLVAQSLLVREGDFFRLNEALLA